MSRDDAADRQPKSVDPAAAGWHVDRRVPLALIWTILTQTLVVIVAGVVAWGEMQTHSRDIARLERGLEREVTRIDATIAQIAQASHQQAIQLGRIEENLGAMRADIRRLVNLWEVEGIRRSPRNAVP